MSDGKMYPIAEAIKAQKSLCEAAGLKPELFPVQAFVGMISDEIESLRKDEMSDDEIATIIQQKSSIEISALEIAEKYASSDKRYQRD